MWTLPWPLEDAVWGKYLHPKWAEQKLRLYGAQKRVLKHCFKKARVSMKQWETRKQQVVFFGNASIGTQGGWGAKAVLQACRKVVERPNSGNPTDRVKGKVVTVDEFRTSKVSSAMNSPQRCEKELDRTKPTRPEGWKSQPGQVQDRLLWSAWSQRFGTQYGASSGAPSCTRPLRCVLQLSSAVDIGKWVDRDCNAALDLQRAGEAPWRSLELRWWPHPARASAQGMGYPGLGFKKLRDRAPKAQAQPGDTARGVADSSSGPEHSVLGLPASCHALSTKAAAVSVVGSHPAMALHTPMVASTNHSWPGALDPPQAGSQGQLPLPLDWHPHRPLLAVADGEGAVQVFDLAPVEQASSPHGHGSAPGNGRRPPSMLTTPSMRLAHRLQPCTLSLAWRPMSGRMLAVSTQGGVLAWTLGGSSRPPLGGLRGLGGPQGGPWVTWLPGPSKSAAYTALAWSPDGRLLAAAGPLTPGITLWSVAGGERSQVGVGLAAFTQLRWSPCGAYLFAAGVGSQFYLLETGSWTSASWSTPPGCGPVTGAAWAPGPRTSPLPASAPLQPLAAHSLAGRGPAMGAPTGLAQPSQRLLLLSFAGGTAGGNLVALHLVEEPPSLVAQLLPVLLQDVQPRDDGHRSADSQLPAPSEAKPSLLQAALGYKLNGRKAVAGTMADWCWDASGERLAVLLQYPHPAAGQVALFAMSIEPVVTARLLGFARPPPAVDNEAAAAHSTSQVGGRVACHQCFTRGALFTNASQRSCGLVMAQALVPCWFSAQADRSCAGFVPVLWR
ncbi:hypothetical protein QJQ45_023659 [Haematococcus lacustris]|nr:hypothetical protein QJQ45_023659 [Haematococcus lacustris]